MVFLEIIGYVLTAIMIGVSGAWIFLIKSMSESFSKTPYLDRFEKKDHELPRVSIILPARDEEEFIGRCLESLLDQDYENYEIIAIDDSSRDSTSQIIQKYAEKNAKLIHLKARPKPEGWMGKNWACIEGYQKATGDLILFTDADTIHSKHTLSLAVSHLLSFGLDALTVIPKMMCLDKLTKITLPMISTFLHTRFSALRVNDPSKKTGYFFGSFFILKQQVYENVGTHQGVKQEIIEDGALGKKVKEQGYNLKMVRGEHLVEAVWARDVNSLWNALKRLMVPLYLQTGKIAIGIFFAVLFLLFMPFPILGYSIAISQFTSSFVFVFVSSLVASILVYAGAIVEAKFGLGIKLRYTLLAPLGSLIVVLGFSSGIIHATSDSTVTWRGRSYSMKDHAQSSIAV